MDTMKKKVKRTVKKAPVKKVAKKKAAPAKKTKKLDKEHLSLIAAAENMNDVLGIDIDTTLTKAKLKAAIKKACKENEEAIVEDDELDMEGNTWAVLEELGVMVPDEVDDEEEEEDDEDESAESDEDEEDEEEEEDDESDEDESDEDEDEDEDEEESEDESDEDEEEDEEDEEEEISEAEAMTDAVNACSSVKEVKAIRDEIGVDVKYSSKKFKTYKAFQKAVLKAGLATLEEEEDDEPEPPKKKAKAKAKAPAKKAKAKAPAKKAAPKKKAAPSKKKDSGKMSRYGHREGTQAAMMDELLWKGTTTKDAIKAIGIWQKKEKGKKTAEASRTSAFHTHIKKLREAGLEISKSAKTGKLKAKTARL
jgi:hypothetical protein